MDKKRRQVPYPSLIIAAGLFLVVGFAITRIRRAPRGVPWEVWPEAEAAGYSSEGLKEVLGFTQRLGTTGLTVVVGGKVLLEYGDTRAIGYMAAGRYSLMAMTYGNYVADGTIDLGLTLGELGVVDREGLLPPEQRATIEDLLTNRSGVYHVTNFGANPQGTPERGSVQPGSRFLYHAWGGLAAKTIFELLAEKDLFQAVGEDLANPLGVQDFKWWRSNPGHERPRSYFTIYNFYVSTRDLAKFGQLMLQKGEWKGEQLIPVEWVERITSMVTPPEEIFPEDYRGRGLGFGYQWWVWEEEDPDSPYFGAYTYLGSYGQYLTVLPRLDMVVAHQVYAGWFGAPERSVGWEAYTGILQRLVAASPLTPNDPPS